MEISKAAEFLTTRRDVAVNEANLVLIAYELVVTYQREQRCRHNWWLVPRT